MTDNQQLISDLRARMEHDRAINLHANPINLSIEDGNLLLEGEVDSVTTKRRVHRHVASLENHPAIVDHLRRRVDEPRGDDALRDAVEEAIHGNIAFRNYQIILETAQPSHAEEHLIGIQVQNGVVSLTGQVESLMHRRLSELFSWWVIGVRDVDNRLHVVPEEQDNDAELTDAIRHGLECDPWIDAGQVHIHCQDRTVTLEGLLPSDEQAAMAEQDVWCILGVHEVNNRIQVQPKSPV